MSSSQPPAGARKAALVTRTVTFEAAADTHVVATSPTTSFGSSPTLEVDRSPESEAYLRFFIGPFEGTVTTARLRVYAIDGSSDGPSAHDPRLAGRNWNERTTWETRPERSNTLLSSAGPVASGTWIDLDVTDIHVSQGAFTDLHLLADSTDGVTLASSEHPDPTLRPRLVLTVESAEDHPAHPSRPVTISAPPATFLPIADTYVSSDAPTSSAGGAAEELRVGGSPRREAHLRFDVQGLTETVQRAVLRMTVGMDATEAGPSVYATEGAWSEATATWNSRPTRVGRTLDQVPFLIGLGDVDYDVTAQVTGNGQVTFGLYGESADEVAFVSREFSAPLSPRLLVWTGAPRNAPGDACMTREELLSTTVLPSRDTYVTQAQPATTFHREASLRVDGAPQAMSYLDFDVNLGAGQVQRVLLQLYALDAANDGPQLFRVQPFEPATTDWNHRPALIGGPVGDLGAVKRNQWVEYDVTAVVTSSGRHTFGLRQDSTDGLRFASVEAAREALLDAAPRLVIVTKSAPFCSYRGTLPSGSTARVTHSNRRESERVRHTASAPDGGFAVVSAVEQVQDGDYWLPQTDVLTLHRADGGVAWTREFSQPDVELRRVAVTALGNVLVAGEYFGAPDLGKGALPQGRGLFVMKLTPAGVVDWTRGFTAWFDMGEERVDNSMQVHDLATDAHGSTVLVGSFWGYTDFGAGPVYSGKNMPYDDEYPNSFVLKLQWDGAYQWARVLDADSLRGTHARSVVVDAQENVTVGGWAGRGTDFGGGAIATNSAFVARWSPAGAYQWSWTTPVVFSEVFSVGVLPDGGAVFSGTFDGRLTFAGQEHVSPEPDDGYDGSRAAMLGRLSATGQELVLRHFSDEGTFGSLAFGDLVVDASGSIFTSQSGWGRLLGLGDVGLPESVAPMRPTLASFAPNLDTRWVRVLAPLQDTSLHGDAPMLQLAPLTHGALVTGDLGAALELDGTWYMPTNLRMDLLHIHMRP
ncbi:DNRLRE domain-containing protein [Myxococcus sp. K15C18031901]|uniref:CBM96 family carbohydrate-binding protein n=1 Tax=Myxococcus dinghuensis TaxID=2906761 RepID=UPI0020A7723F|nr:DNRLRE domain-containing protein [Myxococcus dinghuensis]MCP3098516.1 DNRLRE domain-containing protein [Myxococcus dinghuensis]